MLGVEGERRRRPPAGAGEKVWGQRAHDIGHLNLISRNILCTPVTYHDIIVTPKNLSTAPGTTLQQGEGVGPGPQRSSKRQ